MVIDNCSFDIVCIFDLGAISRNIPELRDAVLSSHARSGKDLYNSFNYILSVNRPYTDYDFKPNIWDARQITGINSR